MKPEKKTGAVGAPLYLNLHCSFNFELGGFGFCIANSNTWLDVLKGVEIVRNVELNIFYY